MEHQDWKPIFLTRKKTESDKKREGRYKTVRNNSGGKNSNNKGNVKYSEDGAIAPPKKVTSHLKKQLQKARLDKKLSQKELATKCNITETIIKSYENGTAVPNGSIMNKMSKVLGVNLSNKPKKESKKKLKK